jgi:hypothetical protein
MAAAIRYRPVVMGEPPEAGQVFYLAEDTDGSVYFRDTEWVWPIENVPDLEAVTVDDLPEFYAQFRTETEILCVREARGATEDEADDVLLEQIEALAEGREEAAQAVRPAA